MRGFVFGNVTVDETFRVTALPLAGETLLAADTRLDLGGKGANQAILLHRAGVEVRLCSAVGRDANADWLLARLAAEGVSTDFVRRVERPTDRSLIVVADSGENTIVSTAACARALRKADLTLDGAQRGDVLVVQGNLWPDVTRAALDVARRRKLRTVLNPAPVHPSFATLWPLVDLAVLNRGEAESLTGDDDPASAARRICDAGAAIAVVTLGADGAVLADAAGVLAAPAHAARVVDTTGAGDTFAATLVAAGLLHGAPRQRALAAAARAAAITVGGAGTSGTFPSAEEFRAILA